MIMFLRDLLNLRWLTVDFNPNSAAGTTLNHCPLGMRAGFAMRNAPYSDLLSINNCFKQLKKLICAKLKWKPAYLLHPPLSRPTKCASRRKDCFN